MRNFKIICALVLITGNYVSAQNSNVNPEKTKNTSRKISVKVTEQFSLFDIESRPLNGKLKEYHDDYLKKHKSINVPPSLNPTPILYDKVIDLNTFYKNIITQRELTAGKINFQDTVRLLCYINSKGKITSGYAMLSSTDDVYKEIVKETSAIETWSAAYFGKTPGDVKAIIQIVVSDK